MNFKEAYADDLDVVFFNMDEFASEHTIDGKAYNVVVTRSDTEGGEPSRGEGNRVKNPKERDIASYRKKIYIRDRELKRKITPRSTIKFDGQNYFVDDVDHPEGVYILYLIRNGL